MSGVPRETLVQYLPATQKRGEVEAERTRKGPMTAIDPKSTIECTPTHPRRDFECHAAPARMERRWCGLYTIREPQFRLEIRRHEPAEAPGPAPGHPPSQVLSFTILRDSGICPIREELHNQCFDEIIRQVTIDCPERGLLLMRVRD